MPIRASKMVCGFDHLNGQQSHRDPEGIARKHAMSVDRQNQSIGAARTEPKNNSHFNKNSSGDEIANVNFFTTSHM